MSNAQDKKMGFFEILELGKLVEKQLIQYNNREHNELKIYVGEDDFKKIDEDMYYRQFPNGEDFQPSDNMILINFEYLKIIISKKEA